MDPLTALSLASNIIQLIDFTTRVVSNCRGIYKSADGALPEHQDLELVTEDILRLSRQLAEKVWPKKESEKEKSLHALSEACIRVSNELLEQLEGRKITGGTARQRKWRSLREAVETIRNKKELDGLASRLSQLRSEMSLHVLVAFKVEFDLEALRNARRFDWLDGHTKYLIEGLSATQTIFAKKLDTEAAEEQHAKTREVIIEALKQYEAEGRARDTSTEKSKHFDMLEEEGPEIGDHVYDKLPSVDLRDSERSQQEAIEESLEEKDTAQQIDMEKRRIKREIAFRRAIMVGLTFPSMGSRYSAIIDAHARTFDWIHGETVSEDTPWSSFQQWLIKESGIYWINGKAGSGKSTLMRFIHKHPRTKEMLTKWAGNSNKLVTPSFFFWNGGGPDQSSQIGLLRSILYTILSENEKMIPVIFPARYKAFSAKSSATDDGLESVLRLERHHHWELPELKQAFQRLLKEDFGHMCIFIDGLDEYSGDPMDTITWFKSTISRKIKICISSRPWVVFEDAFSCYPQLKLQDLTTDDIRTYINDTLCENGKMKELYITEPLEAPKLVQEIISKASGVFLWVRLVVGSLLRGLNNRDKIEVLIMRLSLLPDELEALFTYMLKLVEPIYLQEGSQILEMMLKYQEISAELQQEYSQSEGLSAIELSLAVEVNESAVLKSPTQLMKDAEVAERIGDIDCRLRVRCAGLLEIPSYWQRDTLPYTGRIFSSKIGGARVQWLHRTVKDFLETDGGKDMLRNNARPPNAANFSPSRSLLFASVLYLKRWFTNVPVVDGVYPLTGLVARSMATACQAELENSRSETIVLDELNRTAQFLYLPGGEDWVRSLYRGQVVNGFISLAEKYKLKHYLCDKLLASADSRTEVCINPKEPYFDYLDWSSISVHSSHSLARNRKLLATLLLKGCDPNETCGKYVSGWHKVLHALLRQSPLTDQGIEWLSIIETFLRGRANPIVTLIVHGQEHDLHTIISSAFLPNYPGECKCLLLMLPISKKNQKSHIRSSSWLARTFSRRGNRVTTLWNTPK